MGVGHTYLGTVAYRAIEDMFACHDSIHSGNAFRSRIDLGAQIFVFFFFSFFTVAYPAKIFWGRSGPCAVLHLLIWEYCLQTVMSDVAIVCVIDEHEEGLSSLR